MEKKRSKQASLLLWATVAALLSQNLVNPVISSATVEDQKNYYSPDPNAGSPPTAHQSPPHGSGGGHGSRTPSHGGGSHGGTPPANCGNPPSGGHHTPTPSPPTGGGGYYSPPSTPSYSPPSTPSYSPPSTPGTPSTPSTPTIVSPPSTPSIDPGTPTIVSPPSTPSIDPGTPTIVSPPTTPIINPGTPSIPGISIPSPPFSFDPNSPPFTCNYWRTHPSLIWGLLGWWGTVGGAIGGVSAPGLGSSMTFPEALANTRTDGLGALYREGTASLLNSMINKRFPYTTRQVRERFVAGLSSDKAAAAQAQLFKLANEGRVPRA